MSVKCVNLVHVQNYRTMINSVDESLNNITYPDFIVLLCQLVINGWSICSQMFVFRLKLLTFVYVSKDDPNDDDDETSFALGSIAFRQIRRDFSR